MKKVQIVELAKKQLMLEIEHLRKQLMELEDHSRVYTRKKKHWTQTPEVRARLSAKMKEVWRKKRANKG